MTDPTERRGVFQLAGDVVSRLPPGALSLLAVNAAFMALFWVTIERVSTQREKLIDRLMTNCIQTMEQRR